MRLDSTVPASSAQASEAYPALTVADRDRTSRRAKWAGLRIGKSGAPARGAGFGPLVHHDCTTSEGQHGSVKVA